MPLTCELQDLEQVLRLSAAAELAERALAVVVAVVDTAFDTLVVHCCIVCTGLVECVGYDSAMDRNSMWEPSLEST